MFTAADAQVANYVCMSFALFILLSRIAITVWSRKTFDIAFGLVCVSLATIVTRVPINHFYLTYGTANDAINNPKYFDTHDPALLKTGTVLAIISRILLTFICWLQISILLLFYQTLLSSVRWARLMILLTWIVAGTSFVAITLTTFLECQPFSRYWQLSPDPGQCIKAYAQILVQGVGNIILDIMLLIIALPLLKVGSTSMSGRLRVWGLFLVGTFCMIVTILRVVAIYQQGSAQPTRSLYASIQMLVSVFVANVPSMYGMFKVTKRRKSEPMLRRQSRADDLSRANTNIQPTELNIHPTITNDRLLPSKSSDTDKIWTLHEENISRDLN